VGLLLILPLLPPLLLLPLLLWLPAAPQPEGLPQAWAQQTEGLPAAAGAAFSHLLPGIHPRQGCRQLLPPQRLPRRRLKP
jgi:hypothetical protein